MIVTGIYRYILPTADTDNKEPYVELLVWDSGEEHMVTVKYDNIGSYFMYKDKKYYIQNVGTYFNPVFGVISNGGNT